jgi:hypothetical protein
MGESRRGPEPNLRADDGGRAGAFSPLELANRIWQRRRTKASDERRPASRASRSASLKGRT